MIFRLFAAWIYDFLIMLALAFCVGFVALIFNQGQAIPAKTLWFQITLPIVLFHYYYFSIYYGGQTIGMRCWRLALVCETGRPGFFQLLMRFLLTPFALVSSLILFRNAQVLLYSWTKTRIQPLTA